METKRKKELLFEYKNRKPEMGIICFRCTVTKDEFLYPSKDTRSEINKNCFQLEIGSHPNRDLQALWKQYGKLNFEIAVCESLSYDEKEANKDYSEDLERLYELHIHLSKKARRLK